MFFKTEKERLARRARLVPEEGLEPSRTCVRQILSLLRLPLRHSNSAIELRPHGENGEKYIRTVFVSQPPTRGKFMV